MATPRKYTLERLNTALENYNRTILRLSGQGLTLPQVEVPATIAAKIHTHQELINVTRHFERIMREGATHPVQYHGVNTIKYMRDEMRILNRARNRLNARILADIEKTPVTYEGKPIGTTFGEQRGGLGTELHTTYAPYKPLARITAAQTLESRYHRLSRYQLLTEYYREKNEQYKVNYLLAIERELSGASNYQLLYEIIMRIPPKILGKYSRDIGLAIRYIYASADKDSLTNRVDALINSWTRIMQEEKLLNGVDFNLEPKTQEYYERRMSEYQSNVETDNEEELEKNLQQVTGISTDEKNARIMSGGITFEEWIEWWKKNNE